MVLRGSLPLMGAGILLGTALAMAGMRILTGLLFMVDPLDPTVYLLSAALMAGLVLLATYLPARRIGGLQPMTVLGEE
jgi:ABC-type antimicrobial peptide transport system permease subunit